jgi:hypothetical protein
MALCVVPMLVVKIVEQSLKCVRSGRRGVGHDARIASRVPVELIGAVTANQRRINYLRIEKTMTMNHGE